MNQHLTGLFPVVWAWMAQSVSRVATARTFWGFNPGHGEVFRYHPDLLWCPPSLVQWVPGVFPRGKAAGWWR